MKKIFLDDNIVVDYIDTSARDHSVVVGCIKIIRKHFGKSLVSPITFIIANYLFGKIARNKRLHKKQMEVIFSEFEMTGLKTGFLTDIFSSKFEDLEDAIQYQCAFCRSVKLYLQRTCMIFLLPVSQLYIRMIF